MKSNNRTEQCKGVASLKRIRLTELASPERKRDYNRGLFTVVAPKYDLVTRFLSFGRDAAWKRTLVGLLPDQDAFGAGSGPTILDLACGTADITLLLADRFPRGEVVGLDLSREMISRAERRTRAWRRARARSVRARQARGATRPGNVQEYTHKGTLRFSIGDMNTLLIPDSSVDIVTGGYALRNAPDLEHTLEEVARVLKPGGRALFLDFSHTELPLLRRMQQPLLRFWGQFWGYVLHGDPEVYAYIARSLAHFPDNRTLERLFVRAGFTRIVSVARMFGFVRIIRAHVRV